jgi:group I intron endonuclease
MYSIYSVKNTVTNKVYIGITIDFGERMADTFTKLKHKHHTNWEIQADYNKYGKDSFECGVLEETDDKHFAKVRMMYYIYTMGEMYNIRQHTNMVAGKYMVMLRKLAVENGFEHRLECSW